MRLTRIWAPALFSLAVLAACGSGGSASTPMATATPAPAVVPALKAVVSTPFPRRSYGVAGPVLAPDRNLWFLISSWNGLSVAKLTTSGAYTSYPVPNSAGLLSSPLITGPDAALWFTMGDGNGYFMMRSDTSGNITKYTLPSAYGGALAIAAGSDGNVWFLGAGLRGDSTLVGFSLASHAVFATLTLPASLGVDGSAVVTNPKDGDLIIPTLNPAGFVKVIPGATPRIGAVYTAPNPAGGIEGLALGNGTIFGLLWTTQGPESPRPQQLVAIDEKSYAASYTNLPESMTCSGNCVSGSTWFVPQAAVGPDGNVYAFDKSWSQPDSDEPAHGFVAISASGALLGDAAYNFGVGHDYLIAPAVTAGPDGNVWAAVSIPGGLTFVLKIAPP